MTMRFALLALLVAAADAQSAAPMDPTTDNNVCGQSWSGPTCGSGCCYTSFTCNDDDTCCYAGTTYDSGTNTCKWNTDGWTWGGWSTTEWEVAPTAPTTDNNLCGNGWSGPDCGSGCCITSYTCTDDDTCCPAGSTYDSNNRCKYTTGDDDDDDGGGGGGGGGDPCFSREDTTVCRLTDAALAPSAAFEQCFGGVASLQAERVPMKDLVAGDVVLSSSTAATAVLVQQHAEASARKATMLLLEHETGTLVLTPDHVLKIDGAFKPAREAAVGGVLEPASRITKVSTVTRGIISPITLSGQLLAAGRAGAPVVATVWPEWIAPLMLSSALYPLPYSLASAAAYLFPASVQQFYNEQLEALFTQASPGLKGLKAAVPAPVALAILAGFDAACVGAFAAWACGLKGLVALLAVGLAATARRAAKKA